MVMMRCTCKTKAGTAGMSERARWAMRRGGRSRNSGARGRSRDMSHLSHERDGDSKWEDVG